ncbi:uncharacterized protein LOC116425769 isoform X2 [Nomia melanderi]|nr:uncharacterized protein LOC116425769 isoform X2 [Nomia melanderi]XP_031829762.1 uncharacterized protein LOC116425769 isoform X2 [Nomia melanderi]
MIANLPHLPVETDITEEEIDEGNKQQTSATKKTRKQCFRKSPGKIMNSHKRCVTRDSQTRSLHLKSKLQTSKDNSNKDRTTLQEKSVNIAAEEQSTGKTTGIETNTEQIIPEFERTDKNSGKVSVSTAAPVEVDKTLKYNPQDYVQSTSGSNSSNQSDTSSSLSDDCSCLPTSTMQSKCTKPPKPRINSVANDKVQLYDHSKHQSNVYNKPVGVVEKIHAWTEPSAMDLAQETEKAEAVKAHLTESRKATTQKRGKDAVLREKVRRDYQALVQNLHHLTVEERKLKANQTKCYQKDAHVLQERRKILRDQHKKKLNRALETLLNGECLEQCPSYPMERQITLTPREQGKNDMTAVWEDHCCSNEYADNKSVQSRNKENEASREEQILDMLKKVEKQKQLLLKEFGAELPSDIFNATMKPLFEKDKSVQAQPTVCRDTSVQTPSSPEVKVINVPCRNESSQKDKTETKESSVKKVEIAVQTVIGMGHDVAQDKSIQVEMVQEKGGGRKTTEDEVDRPTKHYPLEPKITVITPEADSSMSTSSFVTNMTNDTGKQYSETTRKKPKHKKMTPRREKQRSVLAGVNKTPTSTRRLPKSLSRSRIGGLRKSTCTATNPPSRKIKIYVNKTGFNIEVNPSQTPEVTVDASTQSSQIFSAEVQDRSTAKSYTVQSKSTRIKMRDVSDSSTSFASLPPVKPRNILEALSNNMSILEMLDSSANESMRLLRKDVSPVSTPETPSPRTMRMPSNKPHVSKLSRMLRYTSTDSQVNDNSVLSSTRNDHSTTSDSSGYQQKEQRSAEQTRKSSGREASSRDVCSCKNPECKLMHLKLDDIHSYALKHCPEILQKYEDLQAMRTERIISLTNLIERVRNEQKGMELSIISAGDETSLMQLPPTKAKKNDLQSVRDLVENIEAIHSQLARTLAESQNIVKSKTVATQDSDHAQETDVETQTNQNLREVASSYLSEMETQQTKVRPKIISDERVSVQLDKYKIQHRPKRLEATTKDHDTRLTSKLHDEEMIKTLSQEILEQSKGFANNLATKEYTGSTTDQRLQTDVVDCRNDPPSSATKNIATQKHFSKEVKRTDFVPLLADIPKVTRTVDSSIFINGRNKPPVSLLSGPYRTEIESSGHELSTIIEFDTPDTVNKSQGNVKSPASVKKIGETRMTRNTVIVQPSEHVAVSVNTHDQQQSEKLYDPTVSKLSEAMKYKAVSSATRFEVPKVFKVISPRTEGKETTNKKLQCDTENEGLSLKEETQPLPSTSNNANEENKNNKDKIMSTSSNSFSGLSGISQIASTPSSDILKYASSPEEMEIALKKLGLGWAITTLKKTREASALSSSSNSDERTPMNTGKRISPVKKQFDNNYGLPDFSDVSSISVKEASKSTEHAVLLNKGRTSTPLQSKLQNSNCNSATTSTSSTNVSENLQEPSEVLIIPDIALTSSKSNIKKLENL